jgi:hypothetical protein
MRRRLSKFWPCTSSTIKLEFKKNLEHVEFRNEFQNTQQECLGLIARVKLKRNSPFLSRERKKTQFRENGSKRYWNTVFILKGDGVQQAFLEQFQKFRSVRGCSLETKPLLEFS